MSKMVERVARAIEPEWFGETQRGHFPRKKAKAVIKAMMEPTEAVWAAGVQCRRFGGEQGREGSTEDIWQAMLTAALEEFKE